MKAMAYFVFLGILAVWRLMELVLSKRNAAFHQGQFKIQPEPAFKWMVALHTSMYFLLPLEWLWRRPEIGGWLTWFAAGMTLLAIILRIWTLWHIGKSWNVRIIGGKGYPICSAGPYAFLRHPNYLVVILELCFIPLIAHLWISALILSLGNGLVLFFRIREEEALLMENPAWVEAMKHKPRFLPFLFFSI